MMYVPLYVLVLTQTSVNSMTTEANVVAICIPVVINAIACKIEITFPLNDYSGTVCNS